MRLPGTEKRSLRDQVTAGALAGAAASLAYAIEQEIDLRAFDHYADDLTLLGGLITDGPQARRSIGLVLHLFNGAAAGVLYATLLHHRIPGSPPMRGIMFGLAENTFLYPLALLEDKHPAIRKGTLSPYWNLSAFTQETLRHVVFGAVLGSAAERLLNRKG
ncbi:MAG TPA: hypothetical protein VGR29_05860 [Thermomicrobiales bacterium]|nr:hypothetical protein [Thermomicrobiales bacterium]